MNTIRIQQMNQPGRDSQTFRAYGIDNKPLGVSASTTGIESWAVLRCAAKAFKKHQEPDAEIDEIETRIVVVRKTPPMGRTCWLATLQPKGGQS